MGGYLELCYYPLLGGGVNSIPKLPNASFTVWYGNDFGLCFEYLVFCAFMGAIFGVMSAFYAGLKYTKIRRRRKSVVLLVRALLSFCILVAFLVDFVGSFWLSTRKPYSVTLSNVVLMIAWSMHLFYLWALSRSVSHYGRGPLNLDAIWILVFVGTIFQLRTTIRWRLNPESYLRLLLPIEQAYFSQLSEIIVYVLFGLQCLYGVTLFFKVSRVTGDNVRMYPAHQNSLNRDRIQWSDDAESSVRQHLISSEWKTSHVSTSLYGSLTASYDSGLVSDVEFTKIEASEDDANPLSLLSFWWVGPLLRRGSLGLLQKPEDLLQLPKSLRTKKLRKRFQQICGIKEQLEGLDDATQDTIKSKEKRQTGLEDKDNVEIDDESEDSDVWYDSLTVNMKEDLPSATEQIRAQRRRKRREVKARSTESVHKRLSLFWSLNRAFGLHYYPLGMLKFLSDMIGFAGPLLLHALVSFMENKTVSLHLD